MEKIKRGNIHEKENAKYFVNFNYFQRNISAMSWKNRWKNRLKSFHNEIANFDNIMKKKKFYITKLHIERNIYKNTGAWLTKWTLSKLFVLSASK